VTNPLWFDLNAPACRLKAAEFDPAAMFTDVGAVSWLFDAVSSTFAPPVGAFLLRDTLQLLVADGESTAGLQTSEEMTAGDTRAIVALAELPL
jgi:hypothetical protein